MKRWGLFLLACGVSASLTAPVFSGDARPVPDVSAYLDQLQLKLDHAAQRANQPNSGGSSVVGLRGTKQEPLSKQLYWKGKKGPVPVSLEEVKAFRAAVEQARAGYTQDAITSLKAFEDKYPKSVLRPDAQETVRQLSQAANPAPATPAVPAVSSPLPKS